MRRTILLIVALAAGVVGGTLFGGPAVKAAAKAQEVLEQNLDASGFIRMHEQGTANVAVTNFPANQNVAITNLPAVQSVALTGRSPFAAGESINAQPILDGDVAGEHTFIVPAGKRLVIEWVSALMILPGGQSPFVFAIDADYNGTTFRHRLTAKPVPVAGYFIVDEPVTINADPGSAVRVVASRFPHNTGNGSFVYAVSGHLESF